MTSSGWFVTEGSPEAAGHARTLAAVGNRRWVEAGAVVALGAQIAVVVTAALPWARSGHASRNSFQLVHAAQRLGVLDGPAVHLAPVWFAVPALVAVAWLAVTLGRPVVAASIGVVVGALGLGAALVTIRAPLPTAPGALLALAASIAGIAVSSSVLVGRQLVGRRGPDGPRPG